MGLEQGDLISICDRQGHQRAYQVVKTFTTDGSWGYFIGHNPGPFCDVMGLEQGDLISICDRQGHQRAYQVVKTFRVTDDTCWEYIEDDVTGYGESAVLQTCCGDNAHYRIVVCAAV